MLCTFDRSGRFVDRIDRHQKKKTPVLHVRLLLPGHFAGVSTSDQTRSPNPGNLRLLEKVPPNEPPQRPQLEIPRISRTGVGPDR
jgi:hypothetical protein